ncbi:MAG: extracellular solute-binding protein [Burkholderiales bacterium]|nr:extracellular solute-binding protein [Burkholderiales bacterium]
MSISFPRRKDLTPRRRPAGALGAAALSIACLSLAVPGHAGAQAGAPESLVKAARAEGGAFMLYSSSNEGLSRALLAEFEKEYRIKGSYLRLAQTPLVQRFATEFDAKRNQADVFSVSSPVPFETNPQWFSPLNREAVPNLAAWPSRWVAKNAFTWTTDIIVLHYNTDQVPQAAAPRKWSEVIDPRWKGKILLTDPRVADNYMGWLDGLAKRFGADFLRKIAAQDVKLTQSGASGVQMIAAGAYAMNFPTFPDFATQLMAKKAPIATQNMDEPMLVSLRVIGMVSSAPHPNTARLYLNWLLSENGIRAACRLGRVSVAGDPDGKLGCTPVRNPEPLNDAISPQREQELLRSIGVGGK